MMTPSLKPVYDFLCLAAREGWYPTYREIAIAVGMSNRSSAFHAVQRLEDRGFVRIDRAHPGIFEVRIPRDRLAFVPVHA